MRTGFAPVVRWLIPGIASFAFIGCGPKAPLTRDVTVSISFSWKDGTQQHSANVEVGALPFAKAKEAIAIAVIRRNATVNEAWKEKQRQQAEFEKLKAEIGTAVIAAAPPPPMGASSRLKNAVEACRNTLNELADTAVLYVEEVKQKGGAALDKDRIEKFRKNLGADELRDLALAITAENTPEVRDALGKTREILERTVWSGRATEKERAMSVIADVEKSLSSARPASRPAGAGPKPTADLQERILKAVNAQLASENRVAMANRPLQMYTALGDAEMHAKTGGDGKCHLILPREERWVVFAFVERPLPAGLSEKQKSLMVSEKEEMCWIIEAPGTGSDAGVLTLSEDNAVHPGVAPLKADSKGE
jgi:hypothetical protein